ncbi:hypothetical protein K0H71_04865 [Bacillus sp. IITD106]|nr:hypothetical protein [Bacillus sp. IITD106]
MVDKTIIQLYDVQIRSIDRGSYVYMTGCIQDGNFVFNHRSEGFGEQSGDSVFKSFPVTVVDDSDFIDFFKTKIRTSI